MTIKAIGKVKQNRIVFQSVPDYSDNPRALSDYLMDNGFLDKYEVFWLVNDVRKYPKKKNNYPLKFLQLKNNISILKWSTCWILLTSKYVFASHGFCIPKKKSLSGQQYITLWHGCSYKENIESKPIRFFDKALVPGPLFLKTKAKFWNTSEDYLLATGYPRYDWLINPSQKALQFIGRYKQKAEKIIIWMPTFRNSITRIAYGENNITQYPLMATKKDWEKLDAFCLEKNVCILVKLHPRQKMYDIDFEVFKNIKQIKDDDFVKANIPMYEFLALTDGLISDYSSVAIDYLIVNKPIAFALDDYSLYSKARGFIFSNPLDYMPGHHLYTLRDLEKYILDIAKGCDPFREQRMKIKKIAITEKRCYSESILQELNIKK